MFRKNEFLNIDCTDEVPMHWVRANQSGILVSIIVSVLTASPWVLTIPLFVQLCGRFFGVRKNAFVRLIAPMLPPSLKTESRVLLRFNNLLAIIFLVCILGSYSLGMIISAYVFTAMLTTAVVLALSGFCLGCFMYFQWKQFRARQRAAEL